MLILMLILFFYDLYHIRPFYNFQYFSYFSWATHFLRHVNTLRQYVITSLCHYAISLLHTDDPTQACHFFRGEHRHTT